MSGIKRYLPTCDCMGQSSLGDYVLHTDHLASHAFDEAVERAAFEAEHSAFRLVRDSCGIYEIGFVEGAWFGWLACAKSRAKRAGGDV